MKDKAADIVALWDMDQKMNKKVSIPMSSLRDLEIDIDEEFREFDKKIAELEKLAKESYLKGLEKGLEKGKEEAEEHGSCSLEPGLCNCGPLIASAIQAQIKKEGE